MPFRSRAQRAWMHLHKPEMAKEWEKGTPERLPAHVPPKHTPHKKAPHPPKHRGKK